MRLLKKWENSGWTLVFEAPFFCWTSWFSGLFLVSFPSNNPALQTVLLRHLHQILSPTKVNDWTFLSFFLAENQWESLDPPEIRHVNFFWWDFLEELLGDDCRNAELNPKWTLKKHYLCRAVNQKAFVWRVGKVGGQFQYSFTLKKNQNLWWCCCCCCLFCCCSSSSSSCAVPRAPPWRAAPERPSPTRRRATSGFRGRCAEKHNPPEKLFQ